MRRVCTVPSKQDVQSWGVVHKRMEHKTFSSVLLNSLLPVPTVILLIQVLRISFPLKCNQLLIDLLEDQACSVLRIAAKRTLFFQFFNTIQKNLLLCTVLWILNTCIGLFNHHHNKDTVPSYKGTFFHNMNFYFKKLE